MDDNTVYLGSGGALVLLIGLIGTYLVSINSKKIIGDITTPKNAIAYFDMDQEYMGGRRTRRSKSRNKKTKRVYK